MQKNNGIYPVVLFLYKRPDSSKELLTRISAAGIEKIYIFADGPKTKEDQVATNAVKTIVQNFANETPQIACISSFSKENLGLETNIVSGLNDVFTKEKAAIILEDDCLPHPDFFRFTSEMLTKYQDEKSVLSVTGTSVEYQGRESYVFSRYQLCWGWATWARAWAQYDHELLGLAQTRLKYTNWLSAWYWQQIFALIKKHEIKTWDYQWSYTHFINHGLAVIPTANLITNIGFDEVATHTKVKSVAAEMPMQELSWPLRSPTKVSENIAMSHAIEKKFYLHPTAILGLCKYLFIDYLKGKK